LAVCSLHAHASVLPGFTRGSFFGEQIRREQILDARVVINAPSSESFDPAKPTQLIFYALPNGNTIEQTMGCEKADGIDWHYDIQHIAAQTRRLREIDHEHNIVIAYLQANKKSWPAWRKEHGEVYDKLIRQMVDQVASRVPVQQLDIVLSGHSGGGSFIFGYINGGEAIDSRISRIAFLDANYAYSDDEHHGEKLLAWLKDSRQRRLIVIAYNDRNITIDGKPVVSATGGTWRASHRMIEYFKTLDHGIEREFETFSGLDGQIRFFIHPNPQNKILHTILVGEMNGFLEAITLGTSLESAWGTFGGPRAYEKWIQTPFATTRPTTAPTNLDLSARRADAPAGHAFMQQIDSLAPKERDAAYIEQILGGNVPDFLRRFATVRAYAKLEDGATHWIEYRVLLDYLAIGSDDDFVRVPMTPMTAQHIADALRCSLPTRKMVDDIYEASQIKLAPQPLTEKREATATFVQSNDLIQSQLKEVSPNAQPGGLIAGIKKDVVITNRLSEKANHVAIYGWHKLDGEAIQPLTIVHISPYVDYSHGIRLVSLDVLVDGKPTKLVDVLRDPRLCPLVSDELPSTIVRYPEEWPPLPTARSTHTSR
jgi:hypothetical protein